MKQRQELEQAVKELHDHIEQAERKDSEKQSLLVEMESVNCQYWRHLGDRAGTEQLPSVVVVLQQLTERTVF